jgi:hypothetical protein
VINSEQLPNKGFRTIEIREGDVNTIYVGCDASLFNFESAFFTTDGGVNWNPIGRSGLRERTVTDLEYTEDVLTAGSDDGLYRYGLGENDWRQVAFDGFSVPVVEALEYHKKQWAATGGDQTQRKLYFTSNDAPWDDYQEIKVGNPQVSFDKEVNDIAAIYVSAGGNTFQSIYIAAQDGLYLLDIRGTQTPVEVRNFIDFQNDSQYSKAPFRYDHPVLSVDYYQETNLDAARYVLVGTEHGVYLITETRDNTDQREITSITIEEKTEGTYLVCPPDGADYNEPGKDNN